MSIAQKDTGVKTDSIAQMIALLERYSKADDGGLAMRHPNDQRDSTIVVASAVLCLASELRDVHNVLHEINQHIGAVAAMLETQPETDDDAPNPTVMCIRCNGSGCANDGAEICSLCDGVGRLEAYIER